MKKIASLFIILVTLFISNRLPADESVALIPQPVKIKLETGFFRFNPDTRIESQSKILDMADQLSTILSPAMGFYLKTGETGNQTDNKVVLVLQPGLLSSLGPEGYQLKITSSRVIIEAPEKAGVFYGMMTLCQLLPVEIYRDAPVGPIEWCVPCLKIEDYPRFSWRGMHLDVGRYFMPKEFVKKYIDLIALHKMNVFHWHLTEDQGWRIEIKKYPKLTEVGAWRNETVVGHAARSKQYDGKPHGGFYTQDDIREIVAYAAERFVTIVPEIEMPGHCQAALAAYPELGNTGEQLSVHTTWGVNYNVFNVDESTISFLQDVLTEVLELFPGKFIHIGGDEVPKKQWQENPKAQARMKELGLNDEHELQSWFIKRMDTFLAERGRRLIGWDEILEGGLAPGATVMSWRGENGGIAAARSGHDVVMAPNSYTYFDHYQADPKNEPLAIGGFLPLKKVYNYEPVPAALTEDEAGHVLGAQAQIWTEYIPNPKQAEYMALPRMCALAEVVWSPVQQRDYASFTQRLELHVKRLDGLDVNYHPLQPEPVVIGNWKSGQTSETFKTMQWNVSDFIKDAGNLEITFSYTSGTHRLDIAWAELRQGDTVLARDEHEGTTGGRNSNNTYQLVLKQMPRAGVQLVASVRSDGGTDSNGDITVSCLKTR